jgi:hypothetical protein
MGFQPHAPPKQIQEQGCGYGGKETQSVMSSKPLLFASAMFH